MSIRKISIVLPVSAVLKFKTLLRPRLRYLHIGNETYINGILAFDIVGNVPFHILRRIWALRESGITNWLHALFDPINYLENQLAETLTAASICGNILVIFIVWSCSVSICIVDSVREHSSATYICMSAF